jgi:hypothetical protein
MAPNYLAAQTEPKKLAWPDRFVALGSGPRRKHRSRMKRYEYKDRVLLEPDYNPGIKECQFQMKTGSRDRPDRRIPRQARDAEPQQKVAIRNLSVLTFALGSPGGFPAC